MVQNSLKLMIKRYILFKEINQMEMEAKWKLQLKEFCN